MSADRADRAIDLALPLLEALLRQVQQADARVIDLVRDQGRVGAQVEDLGRRMDEASRRIEAAIEDMVAGNQAAQRQVTAESKQLREELLRRVEEVAEDLKRLDRDVTSVKNQLAGFRMKLGLIGASAAAIVSAAWTLFGDKIKSWLGLGS